MRSFIMLAGRPKALVTRIAEFPGGTSSCVRLWRAEGAPLNDGSACLLGCSAAERMNLTSTMLILTHTPMMSCELPADLRRAQNSTI